MKVRRHSPGLGPRVRVRPWAFDERVVHLALGRSGHRARTPTRSISGSRRSPDPTATCATIRTGALFPAAAARFADAGFEVIDTLGLLRIDLAGAHFVHRRARRRCAAGTTTTPPSSTAQRSATRGATTPATSPRSAGPRRPTEHAPASSPQPRRVRQRRRLAGFAITGAAAGHGYLQRLAVVPKHQGQGHGRALVVDSLAWMRRRRLSHGLVNTAVTNEPALALYESLGFRRLPDQLVVMQLDVATR